MGAQGSATLPGDGRQVRIEARFVDRASGREVSWGATGQILVSPWPGDPALERLQQVRVVAALPTRQSLTLDPGERGLIRVGRGIPFSSWLYRYGVGCGLVEDGAEWREVESALEVEAAPPAADGSVRLFVTPEFGYQQGRTRHEVAYTDLRTGVLVPSGGEARLAAAGRLEQFYRRFLAGYDPLRRVWPVDLVLRAELVELRQP